MRGLISLAVLGAVVAGPAFAAGEYRSEQQRTTVIRTQQPMAGFTGIPLNQQVGVDIVQDVQSQLSAQGYGPGPVDGIYGPNTRGAVMAFQRDAGLSPHGRLDRQTLAALGVGDIGIARAPGAVGQQAVMPEEAGPLAPRRPLFGVDEPVSGVDISPRDFPQGAEPLERQPATEGFFTRQPGREDVLQ